MKARAEIYGNEAAGLLRVAIMRSGLCEHRLLCFHPGREDTAKTLLSHLERQGRIFQTDDGGYLLAGQTPGTDRVLVQAVRVLLDFIRRVDYHTPADFPVKLVFFADGELYEIAYIAAGQEALVCHALRDNKGGNRRIMLVDAPAQTIKIDCPDISGLCTVDEEGRTNYFKKAGGTWLDRKLISHRIGSILDDISHLSNALYALDATDIQRYPDNYETLSIGAALRAGRIVCRLRYLTYSSTTIRRGDYLKSAGATHGITVNCEDRVLEVTLPCLLPERKQRRSDEFLLDPLYFVLDQYVRKHLLPYYRDYVVCFAQVCDRALPDERIRDYDNLSKKQLLNLLSSFVMADDTDLLYNTYNTAELGDQDCTEIYIMEKQRLPQWLTEHKTNLKSISDFRPFWTFASPTSSGTAETPDFPGFSPS